MGLTQARPNYEPLIIIVVGLLHIYPVQVWLPLYPRDEGHPNFLSKRIMLTLHINIYTQGLYLAVAIVTVYTKKFCIKTMIVCTLNVSSMLLMFQYGVEVLFRVYFTIDYYVKLK